MRKLAKKEISIGISVIVAIVILIFGIDFLKGINLFRPTHFFLAYYDNVDGLDISAPVKVNGYKVGQVREINFNYDKPGKTEVVLALNKNLQVPVDSKAVIKSSLMGEAYIEIDFGSSGNFIPIGGDIPTKEVPGLLSGVSETIMPKLNETLFYVDSLLLSLNGVVSDPALKTTLGRLDDISNNVLLASDGLHNLMNTQIPRIMGSATGMVDGMSVMVGNAGGIVHNLDGVVTKVDTITGNLAHFTGNLSRLPLGETMDRLNATITNLEHFSAQLKNPDGTLGMLMNDPELYNRLNSVAASVDSLIVDIKRNPKRYISIKLL